MVNGQLRVVQARSVSQNIKTSLDFKFSGVGGGAGELKKGSVRGLYKRGGFERG